MAVKQLYLEFKEINIDNKLGLKDYRKLFLNGIRLRDLLKSKNPAIDIKSGRTPSKFNENYWDGDFEFLTMQDIDKTLFTIEKECSNKISEDAIEQENNLHKVKKGAFLTSNAMTLGLSTITERELYINQNIFEISLNESLINKSFLFWYFNIVITYLFKETYSAKYISKSELSRITIPKISIEQQEKIVLKIQPFESSIKVLKETIIPQHKIINQVFSKEFGFEEDLYLKFGKGMTAGTQNTPDKKLRAFDIDFLEIHRSKTLRTSCRYHNPPTQVLMDILDQYPTKKLKDIAVQVIHRGTTPKYDSEGTISVIKTGHLKNSYIDQNFEEFVNQEFYNKKTKSQVFNGDILIASTGKVSLGKIDIIESESELICDGHISIVRIDEKLYNKLFLVYFFRSVLGFFQIERDYTGATNQIELYANEIENFRIPDISINEQDRIVLIIKEQIEEQEKIQSQIKKLRTKIDQIIEEAVLK